MHPGFVSSVGLVTNGVPVELVFGSGQTFSGMDRLEREAWTIATGMAKGYRWSWSSWDWEPED